MGTGYVLDFTDRTFAEFFARHGVDIHSSRYRKFGTSKAKKMRAFWELEPDSQVGTVLSELVEKCDAQRLLGQRELDSEVIDRGRRIATRLSGNAESRFTISESGFMNEQFEVPELIKLPVDSLVTDVIQGRIEEALRCLHGGAFFSVIFLCGSVLEAVLLGAAGQEPSRFNQSRRSPKDQSGKVKQFHHWTLAELIDVAADVGLLGPDVQKSSHALRDFRNYIHPYQQLSSGFTPDEHTANLCFQSLKAALADVSGERQPRVAL